MEFGSFTVKELKFISDFVVYRCVINKKRKLMDLYCAVYKSKKINRKLIIIFN